ncbi:MAG: universal stress protein [Geminicoccaceae bacterium]|nr:MAG: universal stress protein [Geminicoccaceae bacterium]
MLTNPKAVLCAVDLSPASERVLAHAVRLGRAFAVPVHVVHVEEPPSAIGRAEVARVLGIEGMRQHEAAVTQAQTAELEACLERFTAAQLDGQAIGEVFAAWHVAYDRPARAIIEAADRLDAGIIVAGTQGQGALEHLVAGSVARHLANHSPRPLLLVPLGATS